MQERIQKLMSQAGIASRRDAEEIIVQGRVTVNGRRATLGDKADPAVDDVRVDGERLRSAEARVYIMVNKPMGVVTTVRAQEQEKRQTVRDLVPVEGHLYPVGRLDADSEGLVLLTNDGELAERLSHPRYQKTKVYEVVVQGRITEESLDIWRRGVVLDDGPTLPVEIKVLQRTSEFTRLQVTMQEGRKRQIRRIALKLGHPVRELLRTHLATLSLGDLAPGQWRYLTDSEIRALQASASSVNNAVGSAVSGPRRARPPAAATPRRAASPANRGGQRRPHPRGDRPRGRLGRASHRPDEQAPRERTERPVRRPRPDAQAPRERSEQPMRRPGSKPSSKPGSWTSNRPASRPVRRPGSRTSNRPVSRSTRKPAGKLPVQPTRPASRRPRRRRDDQE